MDECQMNTSLSTKYRMCNILSKHVSLFDGGAIQVRNQYLSRPDVQKYLTTYPDVTKEEKKELLAWIKDGNTPYSNDRDVFDESDHLLDFIGAIRAERDYCEEQWQLRQACRQ